MLVVGPQNEGAAFQNEDTAMEIFNIGAFHAVNAGYFSAERDGRRAFYTPGQSPHGEHRDETEEPEKAEVGSDLGTQIDTSA